MNLNNEQLKHLAVTARTVGLGALAPVALRLYGQDIEGLIVLIWTIIAIFLEWCAIRLLGYVHDD